MNAFSYSMIITFKDDKVVAVDYDSHGMNGELWYAEVKLAAKANGTNWDSCIAVPDNDRWVSPVKRFSSGDTSRAPKAYDLVKEFYDPNHKDTHFISPESPAP